METFIYFGTNLRRLRLELGLSQTDFGACLTPSLSQDLVSAYELGRRPSRAVVAAIEQRFKLNPDALLKRPCRCYAPRSTSNKAVEQEGRM